MVPSLPFRRLVFVRYVPALPVLPWLVALATPGTWVVHCVIPLTAVAAVTTIALFTAALDLRIVLLLKFLELLPEGLCVAVPIAAPQLLRSRDNSLIL